MTTDTPDAGATVYRLHGPWPGGSPPDAETVGSKAANLMRMSDAGLPVPPGFVLGTGFCRRFIRDGKSVLAEIPTLLKAELTHLENTAGRRLGDSRRPLLLSVRSGGAVSMPGMMETVLNVGLNEAAVLGLIRMTGNQRLAWDCYRRLIQQFGEVVAGLPPEPFDRLAGDLAAARIPSLPGPLDFRELENLAEACLAHFRSQAKHDFPRTPETQLEQSVAAVLRSWNSPRAKEYRRLNAIPDGMGTAVTVQAMVFGNQGATSGSGVGFSRHPATGARGLFIDFQFDSQGEDVVAGRGTAFGAEGLAHRLPAVGAELEQTAAKLEGLFRDMQDFEFTVEQGRLYLLQARAGKRTPLAALAIAADLVDEGVITPDEALARLDGIDMDGLVRLTCEPADGTAPLAHGVPAGSGVAAGRVAFDIDAVREMARDGGAVVLVRRSANTDDIEALNLAAGLLTAGGARTSHAAVVARQLGKVCLVGCTELSVEPGATRCRIGETDIHEGDMVTLDGNTGAVYAGQQPIHRDRPDALIARVEAWRAGAAE